MIKQPPSFDEVATFVIAMIMLAGGFYGLLRPDPSPDASVDARLIYGGLIVSVATFYFQRAATKAATAHTIEAQNNGLDVIRQTVGRIEDGRAATVAELEKRDQKH